MSVVLKSGVVLTDEMIDKLADEWENDTWSGSLGKVVMGRPRISDDELVNVTFRLPKSQIESIDRVAEKQGESRSEFLRNAAVRALVSASM